jgi:multidrug efflux pump
VDEDLKQRVLNIEGVASATIYGSGDLEIYISLDLNKISGLKMNIVDIKRIVAKAISFTKSNTVGNVILGTKKYNISSMGNSRSVNDIEEIEIMPGLKLKDIASVKTKIKSADIFFNGSSPAVHMLINKSSSGNPLSTISKVKQLIKQVLAERKDIKVSFVNRLSNNKQLFKKVKSTGIEALILVFIIVLLFTFSLMASLVPATAVPVSLIATFIVMKIFKLSFNPSTLGALVLSIGLVVDDAIVILENIHKKIKEGLSPLQAAIAGTAELCLPIILITLTLAFVFLPTLFGEGPTRYEMKEFAIVISSAVIFSGINSLTLSPILSYLLMAKHNDNKWHQGIINKINKIYDNILIFCLKFRVYVAITVIFLITLAILLARNIQSETKPNISSNDVSLTGRVFKQEDALQKEFFQDVIKNVGNILEKYRGIYYKFFYTSVNAGRLQIHLLLKDDVLNKRTIVINKIIKELSHNISGLNFSLNSDSLEKSISFAVTGEKNPEDLYAIGEKLNQILREKGMIDSVWYSMQKSEGYNFKLDFNKIQSYNLDPDRVQEMVNILFHYTSVGESSFMGNHRTYKTWIGSLKKYKYSPHHILNMVFPFPDRNDGHKSIYITLGELIKVDNHKSLTKKSRFMGYPSISFTCGITAKATVGTVVEAIKKLQAAHVPFGTRIEFTNDARDYLSAKGNLIKMIIFAIICIFLILAAQFESLISSFVVLSTAPLAFMGAIFAMSIFKLTFNVYTITGLITLTGLVTKHGILFVSTANSLFFPGTSIINVIREAAVLRLNAVLMTTLAMIFGSIPLAISRSPSLTALRQMCIVIIGGLSLGTLLTIFFTPIVYYYFCRNSQVKKL